MTKDSTSITAIEQININQDLVINTFFLTQSLFSS